MSGTYGRVDTRDNEPGTCSWGYIARSGAVLETRGPMVEPSLHSSLVIIRAELDPLLADLAENTLRIELAYLWI